MMPRRSAPLRYATLRSAALCSAALRNATQRNDIMPGMHMTPAEHRKTTTTMTAGNIGGSSRPMRMTPAEHRAACIKAMCRARRAKMGGTPFDELSEKYQAIDMEFMTSAFDAIPTTGAGVHPTEATPEMFEAGRPNVQSIIGMTQDQVIFWSYRAMAAAGDLTKPPEGKP